MSYGILNSDTQITDLEKILIRDNMIVPVSFEVLKKFTQEQISLFCHKHAVYQVPTTELIEFLKDQIKDELYETIEIGAGNGCIGRSLGIRMTDNCMQTWPEIIQLYDTMKQPTITYGSDVENINGNEAVLKYKPKNVIACWVTQKWEEGMRNGNTFGVDEIEMMKTINTYIHVGNDLTHSDKKILNADLKCTVYYKPWLLSRSMSKEKNSIYVFKNA